MSEISESLLKGTSKSCGAPALLVLEDGTVFHGTACAGAGEVFGEICFNTAMGDYVDTITDLSYAGQILTLTYPQVGGYGVAQCDCPEKKPALRGLVVRDMCATPSNWRSDMSLPEYLIQNGIVAIEGVDTRALVRHIRNNGAQRAVISTIDASVDSLLAKLRSSEPIKGVNLVETVSCDAVVQLESARDAASDCVFALPSPAEQRYHVVAYDFGAKDVVIDSLLRLGCNVTLVPWNTPAAKVLELEPTGVYLSDGPGDPTAVDGVVEQIAQLLGRVPVFASGMGHQLVALACGGSIEKLPFGHHGANQPVKNLLSGRVEITAQNHGFNVSFPSLGELVPELSQGAGSHKADLRAWAQNGTAPVVSNEKHGRIRLTHVNLNDGTAEGMAFLDIPAFGVQFAPNASSGSTDSHYLLTAFTRLMDGRDDYLDIDISEDRLAGWKFAEEREM